jgi:hypothetical protein
MLGWLKLVVRKNAACVESHQALEIDDECGRLRLSLYRRSGRAGARRALARVLRHRLGTGPLTTF